MTDDEPQLKPVRYINGWPIYWEPVPPEKPKYRPPRWRFSRMFLGETFDIEDPSLWEKVEQSVEATNHYYKGSMRFRWIRSGGVMTVKRVK